MRRAHLIALLVCLLSSAAATATPAADPQAYLEIDTRYTVEDFNPDAETAQTRVTRRVQGRETWNAHLRIETVGGASWSQIKRNFTKVNLDFHDVVWATNAIKPAANAAKADGGRPQPVWPVKYYKEETGWTLLDRNRDRPDQPTNLQLVKTDELKSGGTADFNAGFFVEMMRHDPAASGDDPVPLTPYTLQASAAVSGFMVGNDITGTMRHYDDGSGQWSETALPPPQSAGTILPFARRTRATNRRDGAFESNWRRPVLPTSFVDQLVAAPQSVMQPLELTSVLVETDYASDESQAPVIRRRETTTTLRIRFVRLPMHR